MSLPVMAPTFMIVFWMLLGGAAGIKVIESIWRLLGIQSGYLTVAVPVGGSAGALAGALLGLINNPRLLVLLMAVFAGASAGGVAGQLPWGDVGAIAGQVAGGLIGRIVWAIWLYMSAGTSPDREANTLTRQLTGGETDPLQGVQEEQCFQCQRDERGQRLG